MAQYPTYWTYHALSIFLLVGIIPVRFHRPTTDAWFSCLSINLTDESCRRYLTRQGFGEHLGFMQYLLRYVLATMIRSISQFRFSCNINENSKCLKNHHKSRLIFCLVWVEASWLLSCALLCFLHGLPFACQPNLMDAGHSGIHCNGG